MLKMFIFFTSFLQHQVVRSHFTEKLYPGQTKRLEVLVRFIVLQNDMNFFGSSSFKYFVHH